MPSYELKEKAELSGKNETNAPKTFQNQVSLLLKNRRRFVCKTLITFYYDHYSFKVTFIKK